MVDLREVVEPDYTFYSFIEYSTVVILKIEQNNAQRHVCDAKNICGTIMCITSAKHATVCTKGEEETFFMVCYAIILSVI